MIISSIANEDDLIPHHEDVPIHVLSLKATITMGHFVIISYLNSLGNKERVVGQLLRRSVANANDVTICLYLPLLNEDTLSFIASPLALPCQVCDNSCVNAVELVNISKVANVSATDISGLAFLFLESDVTAYTFRIQGMQMSTLFDSNIRPLHEAWSNKIIQHS
jgi:hypothetical protein